ncbi:MAG: OsmC family protein [Acidobacteria bacterium]|jgi:putative redox protein|nr:OsmC family protein [Acidobacteriota bacterium]
MSVNVKWVEKSAFAARSESNHWIMMDSSYNGGDGAAPSPIELVLMGLGGCTGIELVAVLQKMRQDVKGIEIEIEGERGPEHPRVYVKVRAKYKITGKNLNPDRVKAAIELCDEEYCSIGAMLRKTADYAYEIEIIEAA